MVHIQIMYCLKMVIGRVILTAKWMVSFTVHPSK